MHPYWGKAYNPLFSITLSEMLIILGTYYLCTIH